MKKIIAILAIALMGVISVQARDTYTRDVASLPATAQQTLKKQFKSGVNHIKIDKKTFGGTDYEVILNDGTEIDFDSKGQVKEVDSANGVPSGIVLKSISNYVSKNYKGEKIVKYEINRSNYDLELTSGVELKFDRSGSFLRVDR